MAGHLNDNDQPETMNKTKFPRTLEEAFGPHTSRKIEEPGRPMDYADRIVLWGCAVCAAILAALVIAGVVK